MRRNVAKQFGGQDLWRELLAVLKGVADKHSVSVANVSLKWIMQQVSKRPLTFLLYIITTYIINTIL